MSITAILHKIAGNPIRYGINLYPPAGIPDLENFEKKLGHALPDDLRTLYQFCNGFESGEDMFRIVPLEEISDLRLDKIANGFAFAEYMIYCDLWDITIDPSSPNDYLILNPADTPRILTTSLSEFLDRFLTGGVFGKGGLYEWHEEIDKRMQH